MAEHIRFVIEKEEKLQEEILLKDKDFVVDLVRSELFHPTFTERISSTQNLLPFYLKKKKNETFFSPEINSFNGVKILPFPLYSLQLPKNAPLPILVLAL